ncbi:MAG: hypothetical protein M3N41_09710 [Acidobacteriota bacterium]|nr:hypothetical protein [Acidobacteriota bacterium]
MNTNNVSLWRSIRGPAMLVTLGTLFQIDHSTGVRFTRTWPVLLIVLGVLWLCDYLGHHKA